MNFPDWLAILPPLVTITAALVTRHAVGALFLGLLTGSFLAVDGQLLSLFPHLFKSLFSVVYTADGPDLDHISLFGFLWFLGSLIHLLITSGGMEQLSLQFLKNKTSKIKTQLTIICLGLAVFIDDYFNTLAVGTISRPLADRAKISREKLAYFLDSTAGPVCILAPISSWGATIIVILDGIVRNEKLETDGLSLFLESIFLNFYSLFTIGAVFYVAITGFDFKAMKKCETNLEIIDHHQKHDIENPTTFHTPIWALSTLLIATLGAMLLSALARLPEQSAPMDFIRYMEIGPSLWLGSFSALCVTAYFLPHQKGRWPQAASEGFKTMAPAMTILFLAWGLASVVGELKTGEFIVAQLTQAEIPVSRLPLVSFLLAGLLSFTTGTSWATFTILLPIVAQMNSASPEALSLCIAAVLGGSVFGDHCSPISDTSILSSTGAGCNHMSHVMTQLPYCVTTALMSVATYLLIDFGSLSPFFSVSLVLISTLCLFQIAQRKINFK